MIHRIFIVKEKIMSSVLWFFFKLWPLASYIYYVIHDCEYRNWGISSVPNIIDSKETGYDRIQSGREQVKKGEFYFTQQYLTRFYQMINIL